MSDGLHDISICPMQEQDLPEVLAIENASYPRPWSRTHFLDELASPHAFPLSAFDHDGRLVGYICPMQLLDEGHILNVAVHPDCRGRGIGELLVQRVLGDCRLGDADFVSIPSHLTSKEYAAKLIPSPGSSISLWGFHAGLLTFVEG